MRPKLTTESTAGTEKLEKPLCAPWYDPPVLGILLPQRAQRAQRVNTESLCPLCTLWFYLPQRSQRAQRVKKVSLCPLCALWFYLPQRAQRAQRFKKVSLCPLCAPWFYAPQRAQRAQRIKKVSLCPLCAPWCILPAGDAIRESDQSDFPSPHSLQVRSSLRPGLEADEHYSHALPIRGLA